MQTVNPALLTQQASYAPSYTGRPSNPITASSYNRQTQNNTPSPSPYSNISNPLRAQDRDRGDKTWSRKQLHSGYIEVPRKVIHNGKENIVTKTVYFNRRYGGYWHSRP
ncbi:hypothetical protein FOC4_g10006585 [Fusarium odoratissimum]|uniref:Uncharacterized protein n=2 Tax=Fusarium oxysporum species complex TaxID=171631 RepID=N1RKG1_FUSC4|nr:hypothetical protein FOC4_g10006585 [Fusarium odoratissimum]